jgi:MazG family protein
MIDYNFKRADNLEKALMQLFDIVTLLRSPGGCPWDREQTSKSVTSSLMDETYEYLDAILSDDMDEASEEIGDVLLNVMHLLAIHKEQDDFDIVEAVNGVCEKLVRRHPHVFSNEKATDSKEVIDLWNKIKVEVEGRKTAKDDFFSRVPKSLPPLEMAKELQKKVQKVGFDWPDRDGVVDKVKEELGEVIEAADSTDEDLELELGDLLFSVVNLARYLHVDPSIALHRSNEKMRRRFNAVRSICEQRDIALSKENLVEMDRIWDEVKSLERS